MVKAKLFFALLLITGSLNSLAQTNTWIQKNDFGGTARQGGVGFSIGGKGYLGTGNDGNLTKHFWEYDAASDTWTQKADFGGPARTHAFGFSIGNKGYLGTGVDHIADIYFKDFWEYDPAVNTWTQKADFGGGLRKNAVGFGIGSKGYLGTGHDSTAVRRDIWEYDPAADTWTQKADFGGIGRYRAVGFSIGSKGYLGTGADSADNDVKDMWEYDPAADSWTQKADFGGTARERAVGFSIGTKGYLGTGTNGPANYNDFWEYDPAMNAWTQKADFGGIGRRYAVGFGIGNKGYLGTGGEKSNFHRDFWEYTSDACLPPGNLRTSQISDTGARLRWALPVASVSRFKIRYRLVGSSVFMNKSRPGNKNYVVLSGLLPGKTYRWQIRSNCTTQSSAWITGPNFTTLPSTTFSSNAFAASDLKGQNNISANIIPNPNKGSFNLQMYLHGKASSSTLSLYNSPGEKIWQQDAGRLSGLVNIKVALENKLQAGLYVLAIQRGGERIMRKVVVMK